MTELRRRKPDGVPGPESAGTVYGPMETDSRLPRRNRRPGQRLRCRTVGGLRNACAGIPTPELQAGILEDLFAACERVAPERIRGAMRNRLRRPAPDT